MEVPRYFASGRVPREEVVGPGEIAAGNIAMATTMSQIATQRRRWKAAADKAQADAEAARGIGELDIGGAQWLAGERERPLYEEGGEAFKPEPTHPKIVPDFDERYRKAVERIGATMSMAGRQRFEKLAATWAKGEREKYERLAEESQLAVIEDNQLRTLDAFRQTRHYDEADAFINQQVEAGVMAPKAAAQAREDNRKAKYLGRVNDAMMSGEWADAYVVLSEPDPAISESERGQLYRQISSAQDAAERRADDEEQERQEMYEVMLSDRMETPFAPSAGELRDAWRRGMISNDGYMKLQAETRLRDREGPRQSIETAGLAFDIAYEPGVSKEQKLRHLFLATEAGRLSLEDYQWATRTIESVNNQRASEDWGDALNRINTELNAPPPEMAFDTTSIEYERAVSAGRARSALRNWLRRNPDGDYEDWLNKNISRFFVPDDDSNEPPSWYNPTDNSRTVQQQLDDYIERVRIEGGSVDRQTEIRKFEAYLEAQGG